MDLGLVVGYFTEFYLTIRPSQYREMANELVSFGISAIDRTYVKLVNKMSSRVTRSQLKDLNVSVSDDKLRIFENSDDPDLPRFAMFTLRCENLSDIPFKIEEIVMDLEVTGERTPNRSRRTSYPVVRIRENADRIEEKNIGHISVSRTTISARKGAGNTQHYSIEFTFPPWLTDIDRIYIRGYLKVQKDLEKRLNLKIESGDIVYESED